jgi:hypothetical protein
MGSLFIETTVGQPVVHLSHTGTPTYIHMCKDNMFAGAESCGISVVFVDRFHLGLVVHYRIPEVLAHFVVQHNVL